MLRTIREQVELVCNMEKVMQSLSQHSDHDRVKFTYETQIIALEEEIKKFNELKLKLYEDKVNSIISDKDFMDFKQSFTEKIQEKEQAILHLKKILKEAELTGTSTNHWTELFQEAKTIEEIDRPVMMNLVDKVLIHENHTIEIIFKYQSDFMDVQEYIFHHSQQFQANSEGMGG